MLWFLRKLAPKRAAMAKGERPDPASHQLPPICGFALKWMSQLQAPQATAAELGAGAGPLPLPVSDTQSQPADPQADPYPRYYAVNDRPIKLVRLPDGGVDALAFHWESGAFVADRSYFPRISATGIGKDVDQLSEADFLRIISGLRQPILERLLVNRVAWEASGNGEYPYVAHIGDQTYSIRVNDFPAEPLYTLLVGEDPLADLDDWPVAWTKP